MIDIETIGAGGGSIAYRDKAGAIHVGPESAGADPGPAAYGLGGTRPTVTDANVVLGRLPERLAGELELDRDLAEKAVGELGQRMGRSEVDTAAAIIRIMNENMAAALRTTTIERGMDPRQFLLCAFGGAGPLQAAELARILEIPEVLIPPHPGVTSAAGLLTSDLRYDVGQSYLRYLNKVDANDVARTFAELEEDLVAQLHEDGKGDESISVQRSAELRYQGQSYELNIPIEDGEVTAETLDSLRQGFHDAHEAEFGHGFRNLEVELVTLKVTATGELPHIPQPKAAGEAVEAATAEADVCFTGAGETRVLKTALIDRDRMPVGETIEGPAIITQLDSTTVVPPGATVVRDRGGNLLLAVAQGMAR
jgi:N-methylhydantoinase A